MSESWVLNISPIITLAQVGHRQYHRVVRAGAKTGATTDQVALLSGDSILTSDRKYTILMCSYLDWINSLQHLR